MKGRILLVLAAVVLVATACGGDDDAGGTSGPTSTTPTGAAGAAEIARFTAAVQDVEGGNTLSFSGVSCDGIEGPYQVTIAVTGNVQGETTTDLEFAAEGKTSTMTWSMDVTGGEGAGTIGGEYEVELSPVTEVLLFSGTTTAEGPSGSRSFETESGDLPIQLGTGACPNAS